MRVFFIVFIALIIIGEVFSFRGMRSLTTDLGSKLKFSLRTLYWLWTIIILILIIYAQLNRGSFAEPGKLNFAFVIIGLFLMNFAFKSLFGGFHAINELTYWVQGLFKSKAVDPTEGGMTRSQFLTMTGLALGSLPFLGLLYGMVRGRYDFTVFREKLTFDNLPKAFDGVKIVHLSDMHLGSFPHGTDAIAKAVEKVNELEPDYILFTGDMVNERSMEAEHWIDVIKQLKAKRGKFSVLGNHDYGDYYAPWDQDPQAKVEDVAKLTAIEQQMGFKVLKNENVLLEKDSETIRLIGMENWGTGRFSKYGDIEKAMQGCNDEEFQIMMSHDPSHWDAEVLDKTTVDISLAGHTHGFQFGVEIPGFKWSPVQFRYPRWAGLYKVAKQHLYVNRGFGYIGYAGRVGMPPEITLLELSKA